MIRPQRLKNLVLLSLILMVFLAACEKSSPSKDAPKEKAEPAKPAYTWRLAMTWPTNYPIFSESVQKFADAVKIMSQGEMTIRIDSANKHKAPFGILDMVDEGQYEMGHTASYYWKGKDSATEFFTTMPFGMTAPEQYAWFYHGGGMELMQKVYAKHGVYSFPAGNTGVQMGGWFRKEINGLEDLKGLKMRIPGFAGEVLADLGVVVTNIPPGELYTSLDRGTIDALEWVGPSLDLNMGFQKIAHYYYTGWHEPAAELQFLVNRAKFDALPRHLQEILTTAMQAAALDMYASFYDASAVNLAKLETDFPEIKIRTFPPAVLAAIREANDRLLVKTAASNPEFKEVLEAQQAYMNKARRWTRISDQAYLESVGQD